MLHPVEEPSTECQSSDTVNSLSTEIFLKLTPRVSPCVFKSFFDGLEDGHFSKTDTHWAAVVSVLEKGDWIVAILFIFIIFLFQRHGQGTEILSCVTEYEGRWKENRKHGPGTKKLKTGMTEEQVGIQTSCWGPYHLLGKTGYSGWKIKWFAPSCLGSFRKYGLCFAMIYFFYSFSFSTLFSWFGYSL